MISVEIILILTFFQVSKYRWCCWWWWKFFIRWDHLSSLHHNVTLSMAFGYKLTWHLFILVSLKTCFRVGQLVRRPWAQIQTNFLLYGHRGWTSRNSSTGTWKNKRQRRHIAWMINRRKVQIINCKRLWRIISRILLRCLISLCSTVLPKPGFISLLDAAGCILLWSLMSLRYPPLHLPMKFIVIDALDELGWRGFLGHFFRFPEDLPASRFIGRYCGWFLTKSVHADVRRVAISQQIEKEQEIYYIYAYTRNKNLTSTESNDNL